MSGPISVIDSEQEHTRIHSYLEFILHPEKLDAHCKALLDGTERFPAAFDLIRSFLSEALDANLVGASTGKQPTLLQMAVRVFKLMSLSLEALEREILPKHQHRFVWELSRSSEDPNFSSIHARWALRVFINTTNAESILTETKSDSTTPQPDSESAGSSALPALPPVQEDAIIKALTDLCVNKTLALKYRRNILSELFEYCFMKGDYDGCARYQSALREAPASAEEPLSRTEQERFDSFVLVLEALRTPSQPLPAGAAVALSSENKSLRLQALLAEISKPGTMASEETSKSLLALFEGDIALNELGLGAKAFAAFQDTGLSRTTALKCGAIHLVTVWFHAPTSRHLFNQSGPVLQGALIRPSDKFEDIDMLLRYTASLITKYTPLKREAPQKPLHSFEQDTLDFLRLLVWSIDSIPAPRAWAIIFDAAPELRAFGDVSAAGDVSLLGPATDAVNREWITAYPERSFYLAAADDRLFTEAIRARTAANCLEAIHKFENLLHPRGTGIKHFFVEHKIDEFLQHFRFTEAVAIMRGSGQREVPPMLAVLADLEQLISTSAIESLNSDEIVAKFQQALSAHQQASVRSTLDAIHQLKYTSALLLGSTDSTAHYGLLKTVLQRTFYTHPDPDVCACARFICAAAEIAGIASDVRIIPPRSLENINPDQKQGNQITHLARDLVSALETLVGSLSGSVNKHIGSIIFAWKNSTAIRGVCWVLSNLMVFLQQQAGVPVDYVPTRFGPENGDPLEAHGLPRYFQRECTAGGSQPLVASDNEAKIRQVLNIFVRHLLTLQPSDHFAQLALGDEFYRTQQFGRALTLYLMAGCVESGYWTEFAIPDAFNYVLKRVIACLKHTHSFAAAVVLCQFVSPPDWADAAHMIQENIKLFEDPKLFPFFWELPLLEILAYELHKRGKTHLAQMIVDIIGRPEMSELANNNIKKKAIYAHKRHFLLLLTQEVVMSSSSSIL